MINQEYHQLMWINGEHRESSDWFGVNNPARPSEIVGYVPKGTREDVDAAVQAAHAAFSSWAVLSMKDRWQLLWKAAENLDPVAEDIARVLSREQGKILSEARLELKQAKNLLALLKPYLDELKDDKKKEYDTGIVTTGYRSRGVVAGITPWNWPVSLLVNKIIPALLTGNTIVLKPASTSPLACLMVTEKLGSALPKGVVNIVSGPANEVGDALVTHPLVTTVSFTGSTDSGIDVYQKAAHTLKRVTLELGGNDPAIILEDANLDSKAIIRLLQGTFATTGQGCQLIKRMYVHRSIFDETLDKLIKQADAFYTVGNGLNPESKMGPLNNKNQWQWVQSLIDDAKRHSADIQQVGRVLNEEEYQEGYFIRPTFITGVTDQTQISCCEQFGPVLPVMPFDSEEEVIQRANNTEFGLCASVWTEDKERGFSVARQLQAGTVLLNSHNVFPVLGEYPMGGFKKSGIGREFGLVGLEELMELQVITDRLK